MDVAQVQIHLIDEILQGRRLSYEDLPFGHDYNFDDLENLSGELTIIGLALVNDRHIIDCINSSNVSKVIYYRFNPQRWLESNELPFTKPYEIIDASELWENLGLQSPRYMSPVAEQLSLEYSRNNGVAEEKIRLVNALVGHEEVDYSSLMRQLRSIPEETEKTLVNFLFMEIGKQKYHEKVSSSEEFGALFQKFAKALSVSALSPQTLLFLYFAYRNLEIKKSGLQIS